MDKPTFSPNKVRPLGRTRALFPFARRAVCAPILLAVALATVMVLGAGCDSAVAPESAAAAAPVNVRGSWNNWHVHDLAPPAVVYTDAEGLRHEDYSIWPVIWPDYPSDQSPVVYCNDAAEKVLVGRDGGAKLAAGTCRNERYIIHIQLNASNAPGPGGWTALPLGNGFTFYYRLTSR